MPEKAARAEHALGKERETQHTHLRDRRQGSHPEPQAPTGLQRDSHEDRHEPNHRNGQERVNDSTSPQEPPHHRG